MMIDTTTSKSKSVPQRFNGSGGGVQIGGKSGNVVGVTDEDDARAALAFLAQQERNSKFRDKRSQELDKLRKQAHHTRGKIRIKFPDGYVL